VSGYIDPFWDENRAEKGDDELRLEQDILAPLSQSKRLFVYETKDFWRQIKSAGYKHLPSYPSILWPLSRPHYFVETLIG
jgi:hypothetical protein